MIKAEEHLRLAYKIASKFYKDNKYKSRDELNSAALLGLVLAVKRFDKSKGVKFSTFATATIIGTIKGDFYLDKSNFIRKTVDGKRVIEQISIDSLNRIIHLKTDVEFMEWCGSDFDMDKEIENIDLKIAISKLDELQRKIINMLYFEDKTQNEVAELLGTTQVQISRIKSRAINSLRESLVV